MVPANDKEPRPTPTRQQREPFLPLTLLTLAAPLLWVLHFAILYLLEGFLCVPEAAPALIPGAIVLVTLLLGGACVWVIVAGAAWLEKAGSSGLASRQFLALCQRILAGLSLIAIIWAAAGAFFLSACAFWY